jgi:hypothetical protein
MRRVGIVMSHADVVRVLAISGSLRNAGIAADARLSTLLRAALAVLARSTLSGRSTN